MTGKRPSVQDGVLWVGGKPCMLLAGEYPYYRDPARLWLPKLRAMKQAGLEAVSFYIPWRHHEIEQADGKRTLAFDGDGNRDLIGFLRQVMAAGLYALPKPGPFVHAELPLGGLPNRLSPSFDDSLCAALSASGEPLKSQWLTLPSAHDPVFRAESAAWLKAVGAVLRPWQYPQGPIIAVQIGNEGLYGEMAMAVNALDYSACGLGAFRRHTLSHEPPRTWLPPANAEDMEAYLIWGKWNAHTLASVLEQFTLQLGLDVPAFANHAPPKHDGVRQGGYYDAWLMREARPPNVHYAYASWTGNLVYDDRALLDYVLAASRRRGPNLEENWSLDWVAPDCRHACVPIYNALLGLACGATGLDVYTACASIEWGGHLAIDREYLREAFGNPALLDPPYGGAAPIGGEGEAGESLAALAVFTHFLAAVGPALTQTRPEPSLNFYLNPPYSAIAAWEPTPSVGRAEALTPPLSAESSLIPFVRHCLRRNIPFAFPDTDELPSSPLVAVSALFMAESLQRRFADHVRKGGALMLLGELPSLDELFHPCQILADSINESAVAGHGGRVAVAATTHLEVGEIIDGWLQSLSGIRQTSDSLDYLEFRRDNPESAGQFVFMLSRIDQPCLISTVVSGSAVTLELPPRGCALVYMEDGKLMACYFKGLNEKMGVGIKLDLRVGCGRLVTTLPCDVSMIRHGNEIEFKTQGAPPSVVVQWDEAAA